jgi:cytochrome P450
MQTITLRVVLQAVFGITDEPTQERLSAGLRRLMTWTTDIRRSSVFAFLGPDRLTAMRGFRRQRAEVDRLLFAEIAARRGARDLASRPDILSLLLAARGPDGERLSDEELRDELMTLLVAGHETTAAALSWALTELATDHAAQTRLATGEPGLAEAAITETLRLHPPVALGGLRRLRGTLEIAGRQLPAGTTVAPCAMLLHRRADIYDHPTRFILDRFITTRPPAGAWVPFGGGVRRCVGAALAQFEARTVLDEVTRTLELRPADPRTRRVSRRGIVTVPPRGGRIIAAAR